MNLAAIRHESTQRWCHAIAPGKFLFRIQTGKNDMKRVRLHSRDKYMPLKMFDSRKVTDIIRNVENGIYIIGRGSYSIDQQRYNFQFGGQLFYEIKNGEITGMMKDVAYQANTQEFWNAMADIADADDYRLFGTFFDGKGQPSQVSAVSHGSSTAHFKGINVINTGRTLG